MSLTVDESHKEYDSKFIKIKRDLTSMNISDNDKDWYKKVSRMI